MSNSSPPEPPPTKIDDYIAVFVAFMTIGSLLYYYGALKRPNDRQSPKKLDDSPPQPQQKETFEELLTPKPTPNAPESSPVPSSASVTTPVPSSSSSELDIAVSPPTPTAPSPTQAIEFSDVATSSWARSSIERLKQRNVVVGFPDRTFQPNRFATRGEFAAMLEKIFNRENNNSTQAFKDLPPDHWAVSAIYNVAKTGILKGYPAQDFRPDQPVTRAEALVALATALQLKIPSTPAKSLEVYLDRDQVLDYALPRVAAAQEAGLVTGYSHEKLLLPNKPATRAELATMISQALASQENGEISRVFSARSNRDS
jgi:hypothetical protein